MKELVEIDIAVGKRLGNGPSNPEIAALIEKLRNMQVGDKPMGFECDTREEVNLYKMRLKRAAYYLNWRSYKEWLAMPELERAKVKVYGLTVRAAASPPMYTAIYLFAPDPV